MRLAALLLLLAGCATWTQDRPAAQDVRVHEVGDLQGICQKLVGHWDIYLGCAWWNRDKSSCDIFVTSLTKFVSLGHERKHCAGEDHS